MISHYTNNLKPTGQYRTISSYCWCSLLILLSVGIGGQKVTSSIKKVLYVMTEVGRQLVISCPHKEDCHCVTFWQNLLGGSWCWAGYSYSQMFQAYVIKHVSHFQGTAIVNSPTKSHKNKKWTMSAPVVLDVRMNSLVISRARKMEVRVRLIHPQINWWLVDCIVTYLEHRGEKKKKDVQHSA